MSFTAKHSVSMGAACDRARGQRAIVRLVVAAAVLWSRAAHAQDAASAVSVAPTPAVPAPSAVAQHGSSKEVAHQTPGQRLELWLAELNDDGERSRMLLASSLFMSATVVGLLGAAYLSRLGNVDRGANGAEIVVSSLALGISAGFVYAAIARIGFITTDEERYRRWQALPTHDALAIARFEGELETEAKLARWRRFVTAGSSVGLAAVGVTSLVLTPTQQLTHEAQVGLYLVGGCVTALGILYVVHDLVFETDDERAYRMYRAGKLPKQAEPKPTVSPQLSPYGAGLAVDMRF